MHVARRGARRAQRERGSGTGARDATRGAATLPAAALNIIDF
jgi:hypothetical protein